MQDDRRTYNDRRQNRDRRSTPERRSDFRGSSAEHRRSLMDWFNSLIKPRIGVDRRKGGRRAYDRRIPRTILTKDEIKDLLSSE